MVVMLPPLLPLSLSATQYGYTIGMSRPPTAGDLASSGRRV